MDFKVMDYTVKIWDWKDSFCAGSLEVNETIKGEAPWEAITLAQRLFCSGKFTGDAYIEVSNENGDLVWDAYGEEIRPQKAKKVTGKKTETYEFNGYLVEFVRELKDGEMHWEAWLQRIGYSFKTFISGGYSHKGLSIEDTYEDFKNTVFKCICDDIELYEKDAEYLEREHEEVEA